MDLTILRMTFILLTAAATNHFRPFHLPQLYAVLFGVLLGLVGVL